MSASTTTSPTSTSTPPACEGICGPAVVTGPTLVPLEDACLEVAPGVGQTRWTFMPCTPPSTSSTLHVVRDVPLPVTGVSTGAVGWAVVFVVFGAALLQARRRP
jgi:hypothetical protein